MKNVPFASLIFRPRVVREVAAERAEIAAVFVNAVNGLFAVAAIFLPMLSLFTTSLVALLTILFGPLAGFTVSSLYSRVEWTVGRRLGGTASLDELYRLFAWSFLPAGCAALLYSLILLTLNEPSPATEFLAAIPSLFLLCCAFRNYCANVIVTHQFTRARGSASIVLTLALFLVLIAGGVGFLSLLFRYGTGESLKSIFTLQ
ncbi:MAG: hypothetical protein NDI77_13470 [Geobacteraceae bacterium]|nr:hypothetical protein [Geobacteraceae bacterium]